MTKLLINNNKSMDKNYRDSMHSSPAYVPILYFIGIEKPA